MKNKRAKPDLNLFKTIIHKPAAAVCFHARKAFYTNLITPESMPVEHDADNQKFTLFRDGHKGELAYCCPVKGTIDFTHTFVEKALRNHGVAEELGRAGLAFAREKNLKVKTSCTFMAGFVQRNHTEYADLLA